MLSLYLFFCPPWLRRPSFGRPCSLFWKAVVGLTYDMARPSQLASDDGCGDAGHVGFLQDADVGSPIFPLDPEDLAEPSLVVLLHGLQMSAVGGPAISPIKQNNCLIDKEFDVGLDVPVLEHSFP